MHEGFVDTLAAIHRFDWRAAGLGAVLRGGEGALAREVAWWVDYVDWASDGTPTARSPTRSRGARRPSGRFAPGVAVLG